MKNQEILLDINRPLRRLWRGWLPTGVDRVGLAYIGYYGKRSRAMVRLLGHYFVLPKRESGLLFQWLLNPGKRAQAVAIIGRGIISGMFRQDVSGSLLINTSHNGPEKHLYIALLERMKVKPIFFVHDLIPITHPEFCRPGERDRHVVRINNVLDVASGILTNSSDTLGNLRSFAIRNNKILPPSEVVLLAPGVGGGSVGKRPISQPYFVFLSTIEARKNHWMLLQLWRSLVESSGESAPKLVIIGQRGWECENAVDMLDRCDQLKGYVIEQANCSDAELVTYLHYSQALLFPSFAEGYGMPLVEALALGVPVIASDLPVFRETAGDIPEYAGVLDGRLWCELIMEYAKPDSQVRAAQLNRVKGFKEPSWIEHFAKVDAFLEKLDAT